MTLFTNIVGQSVAKESLTETFEASLRGGALPRVFLDGQAGLGKTELAKSLGKAYEDQGYNFVQIDLDEIRLAGEDYNKVSNLLADPTISGNYKGTVFFIDECHKLATVKTKQIANLYAALLKIGDGQSETGFVPMGEGLVDARTDKSGFVLATNMSHLIKDGGALLSRYSNLKLALYTQAELVEILQSMLKKLGMKSANTDTLALIASTGRGTARPMSLVARKLREIATNQGKDTINKDDAIKAMRLAEVYPYGVSKLEIALLTTTKNPIKDASICALLNCQPPAYKGAKAYLMALGFLSQTPNGVVRTNDGIDYLSKLKASKFSF